MQPLLCYLVGGAVRDRLLGLAVKDRDWAVVGSTPEQMLDLGFTAVGHSFPVFLHPQTHEEYALARTERKQGQGYHGFECYTGQDVTLEQDLSRRDLTINAMAEDAQQQVIDPFNGQGDLAARCLRHVSAAFVEDPLRVLRVARFRAQLGQFDFQLHAETAQLMTQISHSGELAQLTPERVWKEIDKALHSTHPQLFWQTLAEVDALKDTLPVFAALSADQPRWQASLTALQQAHDLSPELRFACWCHLLTASELQQLRKQLKAPHVFLDHAQALALLAQQLPNIATLTADDCWQLLKTLNAQRKPERFVDLLSALQTIYSALPALDYLKQAAEQLEQIDVSALMQQKLKGAQLGAAIQQQGIVQLEILRKQFF
jgi:tRNA nucleotidyltransferase (CCA-adding enzyme)